MVLTSIRFVLQRNMTVADLMVVPEQDSWHYTGDYSAMVCDVFVCAMYKAGGLFGPHAQNVQCEFLFAMFFFAWFCLLTPGCLTDRHAYKCVAGTEFTNYDLYMLDLFDKTSPLPPQCLQAPNDPKNTVCQIMGAHIMTLNDWGTQPVYDHFAEKCAIRPPFYKRGPDHC